MEFNIENYHLKSSSLFDFLSREDAQFLRSRIVRKQYSKQEHLFTEGAFSRGVFIVKKGKVKIFQSNNEGKQTIVYIYKKGEFFGYRPLLAGGPQPVTAVAMDNVIVSFIPKDDFLKVLKKSPTLAYQLLINLSQEFSVWINKMTIFSQYGVRERVALSLLILSKVYERTADKSVQVVITITRDDLAGFVGTAKETLVRMLRTFKDQKIISSRGSKIMILRPRALLVIVGES